MEIGTPMDIGTICAPKNDRKTNKTNDRVKTFFFCHFLWQQQQLGVVNCENNKKAHKWLCPKVFNTWLMLSLIVPEHTCVGTLTYKIGHSN